jgi:mRNA interferase HicA
MKSSELLRMLRRDGWCIIRYAGGHIIMQHAVKPNVVIVPFHGSQEVSKGVVHKVLKDAQLDTNKR